MVKRIKRTLCLVLLAALALCCFAPGGAMAAGSLEYVISEQCVAQLPYVDLYFHAMDSQGNTIYGLDLTNTQVGAALNDEQLEVSSLGSAKDAGTAYIILLDISKESADYHFVEAVKEGLQQWVEKLNANDRLVLIGYGDELYKILDGDEDRAESAKRIGMIKQSFDGELFFDAFAAAVSIAKDSTQLPDRRMIICIESGASLSASRTKFDEAASAAFEAGVPVNALCSATIDSSRQAMEEFVAANGGVIYYADYNNAQQRLDDMQTHFNSCLLLRMLTADNRVEPAMRRLDVLFLNGTAEARLNMDVYIKGWYSDTLAPCLTAAEAKSETELLISYSEAVAGADISSNYTLTSLDKKKELAISSVSYDAESFTALLTVEEELTRGDYSLEITGVKDCSQEENPIDEKPFEFTLEDESLAKLPFWYINFAGFGLTAWLLIALIVLLVAGAAVVFFVYRKRRQAEEQRIAEEKNWRMEQDKLRREEAEQRRLEEQRRMQQSGTNGQRIVADSINSLPVTISIVQENGIKRSVDAVVGERFVIGRDKLSCELAIDDRLLSRQHCMLSFKNGSLLVSDLGSTNKTYLNGIVLGAQRQLQPGDTILAGKTRIIVDVKLAQ